MTIREKLLNAMSVDVEALSDDMLVDILMDQNSRLKAELVEARNAIIKEGLRSHDIEERATKELRSIQSMQGDFYFCDGVVRGPIFVVSIGREQVRMYKRDGSIDYSMMEISADHYCRLVKQS